MCVCVCVCGSVRFPSILSFLSGHLCLLDSGSKQNLQEQHNLSSRAIALIDHRFSQTCEREMLHLSPLDSAVVD